MYNNVNLFFKGGRGGLKSDYFAKKLGWFAFNINGFYMKWNQWKFWYFCRNVRPGSFSVSLSDDKILLS